MINKSIDAIVKGDIDQLVTDAVVERRSLEFKSKLPGNSDEDKREFLADVSSFANTSGGDILYGVDAVDGIASAARGLSGVNEDAERLRIEQIIRDGLKPRMPPLQLRFIVGFADGPVLLLRVARSTAAPHMVVFKNHSRFFARSSAGKWQMDVDELRSAFAREGDIAERVRTWRRNRVAAIASNQGHAKLIDGARFVLHVAPLTSFREVTDLGIETLVANMSHFVPIAHGASDRRINIDGLLMTCGGDDGRSGALAYSQIYRDGRLESVLGDLCQSHEGRRVVNIIGIEHALIDSCKSIVEGLTKLKVDFPISLAASMVGARGSLLWLGGNGFRLRDMRPVDREVVELPEVTLEADGAPMDAALRPLLDGMWNAFALAKSWSYDSDGRWNPR